MQCPYCNVQCQETLLPNPNRIDRILVKKGYWECPGCAWSKPIYGKQPIHQQDHLIQSVSCFACADSGAIHPHLVRRYLMPEYASCDPQVPCKRCSAGLKVRYGWDIAAKEDCDRIHKMQVEKIQFVANSTSMEKEITDLADSKEL
ncbi:MAG: hypothetical protein ACLFQP_03560 [Halothece sp.]